MPEYKYPIQKQIIISGKTIASFVTENENNLDEKTVKSFGEEWKKFNSFSDEEINVPGAEYFDLVNDSILNSESICLDVGCGTGRWTWYVSNKVKFIEAIDPSEAVFSAVELLKDKKNTRVTQAAVDNIPFEDESFDFVFSLGVLHHIPDTLDAMGKCVAKVRQGGYFLVYLYYKLENRSIAYRALFHISNLLRKGISKLPAKAKTTICDIMAVCLYMPFVMVGKLLIKLKLHRIAMKLPLHYYTNKTFTIIRNDSLDRFGTPLEQRFTKKQIREMMEKCGLSEVFFSSKPPYWHGIGKKTKTNKSVAT